MNSLFMIIFVMLLSVVLLFILGVILGSFIYSLGFIMGCHTVGARLAFGWFAVSLILGVFIASVILFW